MDVFRVTGWFWVALHVMAVLGIIADNNIEPMRRVLQSLIYVGLAAWMIDALNRTREQ